MASIWNFLRGSGTHNDTRPASPAQAGSPDLSPPPTFAAVVVGAASHHPRSPHDPQLKPSNETDSLLSHRSGNGERHPTSPGAISYADVVAHGTHQVGISQANGPVSGNSTRPPAHYDAIPVDGTDHAQSSLAHRLAEARGQTVEGDYFYPSSNDGEAGDDDTTTTTSLLSSSRTSILAGVPWSAYRKEARTLARLSYPVVLAYLLQYSITVASVFALGHLGASALAASALATMFASVTGWAFGVGLVTALDTLCSQSFTGASDIHAVGVYLQRGIVAIVLCHVPICIMWWHSETLLLLIGQPPQIAHLAGLYLRYLVPACLPSLLFECVKRYLQAQEIMHASTLVLCFVSPLNFLLNFALVWWEPIALGYIGAPIATCISNWLMFILIVLYASYVDGYQAWGGWSRQAYRNLGQFMSLGLPGVVMICAEWWAFEFTALAISYMGETSLAAQSILFTTVAFAFQIPEGIAVSCTNRIGNLLGAGKPRAAAIASRVGLAFAAVLGLLVATTFMVAGRWWGYLFTDVPEVVQLVANLMSFAGAFQVLDGTSAVLAGILRGQGRQKLGAILTFPSYYILAIPLGLVLGFRVGWGIYGVWAGLCAGISTIFASQLYFVLRSDWVREVDLCRKRVGDETDIESSASSQHDEV
ncbi:ethionine resistance protein [Tieghemiomyces parasiticus]|uniref:Ethionine resistance protein n=1 Tax=Tieghemiomyces parasiticus TaxID=78921 RepID=A0A9W8ACC8_9FUNG|nr:ethionine resistance protein [Tieghemiomyces parasiticus]